MRRRPQTHQAYNRLRERVYKALDAVENHTLNVDELFGQANATEEDLERMVMNGQGIAFVGCERGLKVFTLDGKRPSRTSRTL